MFNPVLLDLTGMPAEALAIRPSIRTFLDGLRERGKLPEHRDYRSWREQVADLEAKAESGTYAETWTLTSGQTLRVTGRPHPDGAIAFLFEDISAEVTLTRRYRAEIETGRAVLDALPEAIAVFSRRRNAEDHQRRLCRELGQLGRRSGRHPLPLRDRGLAAAVRPEPDLGRGAARPPAAGQGRRAGAAAAHRRPAGGAEPLHHSAAATSWFGSPRPPRASCAPIPASPSRATRPGTPPPGDPAPDRTLAPRFAVSPAAPPL